MNKKTIGLITLCIALSFGAVFVARAGIPYAQVINDVGLADQTGTWDGGYQYLGTGLEGAITQLDFYLGSYCVSTCFSFPNVSFTLYENTTSSGPTGGSGILGKSITSLPEGKNYYSATGTVSLDPDKHYWITTRCSSGCYAGSGTNRAFQTFGTDDNEWSGGQWYGSSATGNEDVFFIMWGGGTAADDAIAFAYPVQDQETPLFSPWLLTADNLSDGHTYRLDVQWYASPIGTSTPYSDFDTSKTNTVFFEGTEGATYGIEVPRAEWGFSLAQSSTVWATASLFDTQDPDNPTVSLAYPIMTASTSISFTLLTSGESGGQFIVPQFNINDATSTITTSTRPIGSLINPTFSFAQDCSEYEDGGAKDMWDYFDLFGYDVVPVPTRYVVEGAFCYLAQSANDFIAGTSEFGVGTIQTFTQKIKRVFPISIFVEVNDIIEDAKVLAAENANDGVKIEGAGNVLPGTSITLLNSSTMMWVTDDAGFDHKAFFDKILYFLTGTIVLVGSIAAPIAIFGGTTA